MIFGKSFSLGRYFGIDLRVDYSWFIIFFLILTSFSSGYLPRMYPQLTQLEYGVLALLLALLFFGSVVVHEFAHGLYARSRGIRIERMVFFLFGGAAEVQDESPSPRVEFVMAGLGPLTSYVIAFLFAGVWLLGVQTGVLYLEIAGSTLSLVNFAVATFNALPAYPLDGGRMLRAVIWHFSGSLERSTRYTSLLGRGLALLLMAYGLWQILAGLFVNGLWLIMLGFFLDVIASRSYTQVRLQQFKHRPVADYMERAEFADPHPADLAPESTLLEAYEHLQDCSVVYIGRGDYPEGFLTREQLYAIMQRELHGA